MKTTPPHPGPVNQLPASGIGRRRQPPNLSLVYYPNPILRAVCQPVDHSFASIDSCAKAAGLVGLFDATRCLWLISFQNLGQHRGAF